MVSDAGTSTMIAEIDLPNHAVVLLLSDVGRDLALHLARLQCHGQRLGHVLLYRDGYGRVLVGGAHPEVRCSFMFKLTRPKLGELCSRDQRKDNVGGEALFQIGFDAEGVGGVDEDAGVLWRDNGLDDASQVVDIGEGLYAEQNVVERGARGAGSLFRGAHDCRTGSVGSWRKAGWLASSRTMSGLKALVAKPGRSVTVSAMAGSPMGSLPYLNEMPYCETASKLLFQTSVTSHALVADKRQERKAETAFPPTTHTRVSSSSSSVVMVRLMRGSWERRRG